MENLFKKSHGKLVTQHYLDLHASKSLMFSLPFAQNVLKNLSWFDQELLANHTVNHPVVQNKPLRIAYQIAFLKHVIESLEAQQIEIHDLMYEKYAALKLLATSEQPYAYKHYKLGDYKLIVSLKESQSFIAHGTTGLITWQAGTALAEWACAHPHRFRAKSVLELGAGTGLTGFVIAKICQPEKIVLTDGNPIVLKLLEENFSANFSCNTTAGMLR